MDDAGVTRAGTVEAKAAGAAGYEVTGHRLEFLGYCARCRMKRASAKAQG